MKKDKAYINVAVDRDLHTKLKIACFHSGMTLKEYIEKLLKENL